MKAVTIALAVALFATGGVASAQTASDAQCIVVANVFAAQAKEERAKKIAEASMYFYLGRIGNSMTAPQLKTLLDAQMKTINNETAPGIMNQCAATLQAKAALLETAGGAGAKPAAAKPATTPKTTQPAGR